MHLLHSINKGYLSTPGSTHKVINLQAFETFKIKIDSIKFINAV